MKLTLAILTMLTFAWAIQGPQPVPPFEGDGNESHDGQPAWCQNHDTKTHLKNCDCQPKMGDKECQDGTGGGGENSKCSVYCRKTACRCERECGKTE